MTSNRCTAIRSRTTGRATRTHHITFSFSDGQTATIKTTKSYAYLVVAAWVSDHDNVARAAVLLGTGSIAKADAKQRSLPTHRHILVMDTVDGDYTYAPWDAA